MYIYIMFCILCSICDLKCELVNVVLNLSNNAALTVLMRSAKAQADQIIFSPILFKLRVSCVLSAFSSLVSIFFIPAFGIFSQILM